MAGLLDGVDMRTKLAGHNRLELLLFRLGGRQRFGINVFKVQEVIQCPSLTSVPQSHPVVLGIANMRGKTIAIMDLARAIGAAADRGSSRQVRDRDRVQPQGAGLPGRLRSTASST